MNVLHRSNHTVEPSAGLVDRMMVFPSSLTLLWQIQVVQDSENQRRHQTNVLGNRSPHNRPNTQERAMLRFVWLSQCIPFAYLLNYHKVTKIIAYFKELFILLYLFQSVTFRTGSPQKKTLPPRATEQPQTVAQECRTVPSGDRTAPKRRPRVPSRALGRQNSPKPLPKSAAPYARATEQPRNVAQECRAVPSGDRTAPKRRPRVPRRTLGRQNSPKPSPRSSCRSR